MDDRLGRGGVVRVRGLCFLVGFGTLDHIWILGFSHDLDLWECWRHVVGFDCSWVFSTSRKTPTRCQLVMTLILLDFETRMKTLE